VGKLSLNAAQPYAKAEGGVFLLVPAYPGCPGTKAVKRLLLLVLVLVIKISLVSIVHHVVIEQLLLFVSSSSSISSNISSRISVKKICWIYYFSARNTDVHVWRNKQGVWVTVFTASNISGL